MRVIPDKGYWLLGHRGARYHARANTIAAFESALALGADGMEFDVRLDRTDTWVLHHDKTIRDGAKRRPLEAYEGAVVKDRPDTMREVVEWLQKHPQAVANVEIKQPGNERTLLALLAPVRERTLITSFVPDVLHAVNGHKSGFATGFLASYGGPYNIRIANDLGCGWIVWRERYVTPTVAKACQDATLQMFAWDVDTRTRVHELVDLGVTGIISDHLTRTRPPQKR